MSRWLAFPLTVAVAATAQGAPDQEVVPPNESADIQAIVKSVQAAVGGAYAAGTRPAMRDAHAKGHGCVKGELTVDAGIPPQLRRGVFAQPHSFAAWIRFSNGAGTPHDDYSGDGRGMAIKLTGVPGEKLLADEHDAQTQDFVMINYPVFFIRSVADYVPFTALSIQNKTPEFFATHPYEAGIVKAIARPAGEMFTQRYFSMSAYRLGDAYIKFSARPVDCASGAAPADLAAPPAAGTDPNYLRTRMVKWLSEKDACFKFAVQPQTHPATQPIEDATVEWKESEAPFIDVASIRIPKQSFDSPAQQRFCENLSFTPWHALPAHRPVGGLNRLRQAVYMATSVLRHRLNDTPRVEPTGGETLPADPPAALMTLGQNIDQATLRRYHYTDQGTRLLPAAWLAALEAADGSAFMADANLRRLGFLIDPANPDPLNPFRWPVGFSVSDPKTSGGIPVAGLTCALCHTGEIDYHGTAMRIEGGQAMIDLTGFVDDLYGSLAATLKDPPRRQRFITAAIQAGYPAARMETDFAAAAASLAPAASSPPMPKFTRLPAGRGRLDAVQGIANQVFATNLRVPANARDLDAPVNFPYLWDIWRLSWLQYNAFLPRRHPTSRNIGEALGTKAEMHLLNPTSGALNPEPLRWQTSVQLDNLLWMEKTLESLRPPVWPAAVLGPIDQAKAARGRRLFDIRCAGCHGIKRVPEGGWDVSVVSLDHIGTDPGQARNWAARRYDASKLGLGKETPTVDLAIAINAVRKQLYTDNHTPLAEQESDVAFEAPCGYKARPLIGVWATPPFLHNGSVRTVFDLLSDTRPARFRFGSLEYDPVHLGYREDEADDSMILDTALPGNRNTGHWFTDDTSRPGRIGPKFTDGDKYALIEFLKAAGDDNYPSQRRTAMQAMPCEGDPNWAHRASLASDAALLH